MKKHVVFTGGDRLNSDNVRLKSNVNGRPSVEGIRWVPGTDRRRPSVLELQLSLPASASVARVYVGFEKAFLRLAEFPPDANRGFDLPAALLLLPPPDLVRFNRNRNRGGDPSSSSSPPPLLSPLLDAVEGLAAPPGGGGGSGDGYPGSDSRLHSPEAVYMGGLLLPLPTPDFSMPFNVITMVGRLALPPFHSTTCPS